MPRLTAKRVERVVSISWASCSLSSKCYCFFSLLSARQCGCRFHREQQKQIKINNKAVKLTDIAVSVCWRSPVFESLHFFQLSRPGKVARWVVEACSFLYRQVYLACTYTASGHGTSCPGYLNWHFQCNWHIFLSIFCGRLVGWIFAVWLPKVIEYQNSEQPSWQDTEQNSPF